MRLIYSGREFAWLYERCGQLAFLDGHVRAFAYLDGVVRRCVYDSLKPAVRQFVGAHRVLSERFLALVSHYLFEPNFTRIGEGHDKGRREEPRQGRFGCNISRQSAARVSLKSRRRCC